MLLTVLVVYCGLVVLITGLTVVLTGNDVEAAWDYFFEKNEHLNWAAISEDEAVLVGFLIVILSPILLPAVCIAYTLRGCWKILRGVRKLVFRVRSRKFVALANHLEVR